MSQTVTRQRHYTPDTYTTTPTRIQRLQRAVVNSTNDVIHVNKNAKQCAIWCLVNCALAIVCYVVGIVQLGFNQLFSIDHVLFSYLDLLLFLLFCWNILTNVYIYCLPVFHKQNIILNPQQKQLLGITKDNEHLFQSSPTMTSTTSTRITTTPTHTPSYPIRRSGTRTPNSTSYDYSPGHQHSPSRGQSSPKKFSPGRNTTPVYSQNAQRSSSRESFYTPSFSSNSPLNTSRALSLSSSPSPSVFNQSPSFGCRQISPSRVNSQDEQLLNYTSLDKYIKQEEEQDARLRRGQDSPQKPSFWKYGAAAYEYIPLFGSYQLATRSQTPNVKDDDDSVESLFKQDEIWRSLGFQRHDVSIWTENIRKWLAQTVLEPIVQEIEHINKRLTQIGNPELHIGLAGTSSLQTLIATKGQHFPSLATILPYLHVTTNQEYLVTRLTELSTGGCLRLYRWDGGGLYKGKAWNSDLPTDAEIVMHLFCTYMDTHLPSNPRYADGKSFSGLHFLKTPIKPEEKKSALCIYQYRTRKPHFKVLSENETCELPKGRNNLFYAIVVFLYYVKRNYHGMLQRVNLGMSGINILWILEKK